MKNVIFYFTGTGNSLKIARELAAGLEGSEVRSMALHGDTEIDESCESIGFVFPTYYLGAPLRVEQFIKQLQIPDQCSPYFYAVTNYGNMTGYAIPQVHELLEEKGRKLNYGAGLKMPSNYIVMYDKQAPDVITSRLQDAQQKTEQIILDVSNRKQQLVKRGNGLIRSYYRAQMSKIARKDSGYQVDENCTSCGICKKVCPVDNIIMISGKPTFQHHCEQCVACIQYCPVKAINYKNKTQKRTRYMHPEISWQELGGK